MKSTNYFWIALAAVVSAFLTTSVQAQQAPSSPFTGISQAQQIFGPKITPDALQGKVVFVEYWGTRCGPCRQSMPHLQQIYNQLGNTGLFCIIGNHVQEYTSDTDKFLKQTGVTFPVYQQLNLPINKRITSIPQAFLFDVSGRLVAEGHPTVIVNQIPALVQQAALMKKTEIRNAQNSPVADDLNSRYANSSKGNFEKTAVAMFTPDKPWQDNYKHLQKKDQINKIFEPHTSLTAHYSYTNPDALRLIELAKTNPAKAYASIAKLNSYNMGVSQDQALANVFQTLSADKRVKDLSDILTRIAELESMEKHMTRESAKAKAQSLFLSLKAFYYGNDLSPELKKETCDAARKLKQKYACSGKKTAIVKSEVKLK